MKTQEHEPQSQSGEYLTFHLGSEEYGIPILEVQEIRGYSEPTHLASAPAFVKGVLNLRGTIVPIVDLRLQLNLPEAAYDGTTVIIVLNICATVVGVVVDAVSDVTALASEQMRPVPDFQNQVDTTFITGIATVTQGNEQRMLILIDMPRLLGGVTSQDAGISALAH